MISKAQVKYIQSLKLSKFRQKYNIFISEGDKIVKEIIEQKTFNVQQLIYTQDWVSKNHDFISINGINDGTLITENEMKKLSSLKTPPGILALVSKSDLKFSLALIENEHSIYVDQIKDPGNLGAIIRIADWYGFKNVICAPGTVDYYNPKTVQATMGSIARVNLVSASYEDINLISSEISIYTAVLDGVDMNTIDFADKGLILVIGNESRGVSDDFLVIPNQKIAIANKHRFGAESLNAAIATGIICATIRR